MAEAMWSNGGIPQVPKRQENEVGERSWGIPSCLTLLESFLLGDMGHNKYPRDIRCIWLFPKIGGEKNQNGW